MSIQNFFKSLTSASARRRPDRRRPPVSRLRFEPLEERRLLSFSPPVDYGASLSPLAVVAADFNGDGQPDLAANHDDNTFSVLLGNGDGTFQAPRTTSGAGYLREVADLNRDGNADLVTIYSPHINLLLGNGDGTFQAPQSIVLPAQLLPGWTGPDPPANYVGWNYVGWNGTDPLAQSVAGLAIGDMNGDGTLDIVASGIAGYQTVTYYDWGSDPEYQMHTYGYANVLLGNGDGTFLTDVKSTPGGLSYDAGDFNNDGRLDLLTTGGVLPGNGDGTFGELVRSGFYPYGESQSVVDLNGDGNLDLLSNVSHIGGPILQLGNGDGTFQQYQRLENINQWGTGTVAGDVNADGKLDVVSLWSDYEWSEVVYDYAYVTATNRFARVLLGNDYGSFSQPIIVDLGTVAGQADFMSPVLADFDGDGFPDLAATEKFTSEEQAVAYHGVHVALNDGNWTPPPPPPPSITMSDVTISEGNIGTRTSTFTVTLSAAYGQPVTVAYATADGAATVGSDYQAASGTLTFAPGETSKSISVLVNGDRLGEANETFFVNLSSPTNATIADGQAVGTIVDDEPRISISDVTKAESKKGQTTLFTFTVTLSAAYDQPVTISYRTANGTATTGNNDYIAKTGTLTFNPGETMKTITIEVKGDSKREANETFYLDLFGLSSNALFTKNRGLGTILNDD